MEAPGYGVRVPREEAELTRRALIQQKVLSKRLKPRIEGEYVLFPVESPLFGAEEFFFDMIETIPSLPRHDLIGGIAVMAEPDTAGAELLLAQRRSIHTVLFAESEVEGEFRTRRWSLLAGKDTRKTVCMEHGQKFLIDLEKAFFSSRLVTERQRVLQMVENGETVLDMFAGVGPFAIVLAKRAGKVIASELNPSAVTLIEQNIKLNKISNVLPFLADARHLDLILEKGFDRIVMNLPHGATCFLPFAFRLIKSGGTIHWYAVVSKEGMLIPVLEKFPVKKIREHRVRSYAPGRWHVVYDIVVV